MNPLRQFINDETGFQRLEIAVIVIIVIIVIAILYASRGKWQSNTLM